MKPSRDAANLPPTLGGGRSAEAGDDRIEALVATSSFQEADRFIYALIVLGVSGHPGWKRAAFREVSERFARIGIMRALAHDPELDDGGALIAGMDEARRGLATVAAEYVQSPEVPEEAISEAVGKALYDALSAGPDRCTRGIRDALDAGAWEAVLGAHPGGTPHRATITPILRSVLTRGLTSSTGPCAGEDLDKLAWHDGARELDRKPPRVETLGLWKWRTTKDLVGDALLAGAETGESRPDGSPRGDPRDIPIENLGMGLRTSNALLRGGLRTLGDVARLAPSELAAVPYFGTKGLREVGEILRQHGLVAPVGGERGLEPPRPGVAPRHPRNAEMIALRKRGLSLAEIASKFGVSRERVRQITAHSTTSGEASNGRRARQLTAAQAATTELREGFREGRSAAELAQALGLVTPAVDSVLKSMITPLDRAERKRRQAEARHRSPTYSHAELIRAVQRVAERVGKVPSSKDYRDSALEMSLPSLPTLTNRFGGWSAAVRAAGMTPHPPRRSGYSRRWTEEACWRALAVLVTEFGELPTAQQYDVLASADDSLPSLATVRNRLGRWSEVAARLLATPHPQPTLGRLGVSGEASPAERDETIWLAHLAGDVSDEEIVELLRADLFTWQPSYGPPPET